MAESANGGNTPGQPPKELSMEIRLLLAFLLMGAVMFVTPYLPFFKTTPPPVTKPPEAATEAPGGQPGQPSQPPAASGQPGGATESKPAASAAAAPSTPATPQESLPLLT